MEIKATNTATLNPSSVLKLKDLLNKVDNSLFKAIINQKLNNNTFLLNSKAGNFHLTSTIKLQVGDELTLNIPKSSKSADVTLQLISINRPTSTTPQQAATNATLSSSIALNINVHKNSFKNIPNTKTHFVAKVINNTLQDIQFKTLKGDIFSLDKKNLPVLPNTLNKQQFVTIKWQNSNHVDIQPIAKDQLLHQIQRQLLPKQNLEQSTHQRLNQAAFKLFQSIKNELSQVRKSSFENTIKPIVEPSSNQLNKALKTINTLKNDLQNLLSNHALKLQTLKPETIKLLLTQLDLISNPNQSKLSQSFVQKLSLINQSIDQILSSQTQANKQQEFDQISDFLKNTLAEAKQSIEANIQKLLLQATSSKITQETQITQLINSQIPLEIEKQTKDVALKIKQRKKENEKQDDSWEIQLSLEMGILGLISTKILLVDNNQISVLFWADLENTKQLIEDKKHIFKQQLSSAGFTINHLNIFLGTLSNNDETTTEQSLKQFIDVNV